MAKKWRRLLYACLCLYSLCLFSSRCALPPACCNSACHRWREFFSQNSFEIHVIYMIYVIRIYIHMIHMRDEGGPRRAVAVCHCRQLIEGVQIHAWHRMRKMTGCKDSETYLFFTRNTRKLRTVPGPGPDGPNAGPGDSACRSQHYWSLMMGQSFTYVTLS